MFVVRAVGLLFIVLASLAATPARADRVVASDTVTVGAFINDIQLLDLKNHNFTADIYIWFRWRDPSLKPAESFEYTNPFELWGHNTKPNYDKPVRLPNGEFYQVIRTHGRFSQKFILDNYPFDHQTLKIGIEDSRSEEIQVRFVPDENPISLNPKLQLPGFIIGKPTFTIVGGDYPTNFGDIRSNSGASRFSHVNIEVPIHRPMLAFTIKFLLPIVCVVFAAGLMFVFSPSYVDSRVGIGITALLTIVALQITLNEDLPEIDYLVLIDKIYLTAYLYVIAGLAVVVKTTWIIDGDPGEAARAKQLDRRGLAVLTLIYMLAVVYFLYPVLTRA